MASRGTFLHGSPSVNFCWRVNLGPQTRPPCPMKFGLVCSRNTVFLFEIRLLFYAGPPNNSRSDAFLNFKTKGGGGFFFSSPSRGNAEERGNLRDRINCPTRAHTGVVSLLILCAHKLSNEFHFSVRVQKMRAGFLPQPLHTFFTVRQP